MMDLKTKTAFVIEDDKDICTLLSIFLQSQNIKAITAHTLAQASSIADELNPSFIFLDHRLPDGYGFDYIAYLKQKFPEANLIAMTAQHTNETRESILNQGITHYLEKPFKLTDLKVLINKCSDFTIK